jgi:hypothetical protein
MRPFAARQATRKHQYYQYQTNNFHYFIACGSALFLIFILNERKRPPLSASGVKLSKPEQQWTNLFVQSTFVDCI